MIAALFFLLAQSFHSDSVDKWRASGDFFTWQSPQPENRGRPVQVFWRCAGDPSKSTILMLHGFPTSSFDYHLLIEKLPDFRVCTLDFPGYGLSSKPANEYRYSLSDDAQLTWYFVTKVAKLSDFTLVSHDRGDSVALAFLALARDAPFRITHQFLMNGNMYLPLANLTAFQKRALDPATSATLVKTMSPALLAAGMGLSTYTPTLQADDAEVRALAALFSSENQIQVLPATIQYLNERKQFENDFLETLHASAIPATILWGVHDMISPVRVADYVWNTALKSRDAAASYWMVPCANHYLQHDQPEAVAGIVRLELGGKTPAAPYNLSSEACAPVLQARHP